MKRQGPIMVAFLTGVIVLGGHYLRTEAVIGLAGQIVRWRVVVAAFALALGGANMFRLHGATVARKGKNWPYSVVFMVSFAVYFLLGVSKGTSSPEYSFIWQNMYQPAASTMYSFTLFYMTSACFRAFRIRNWQSGVLMVAGAIVLLGQVGVGAAISPRIPALASWIIEVPNAAAIRAITIGGSLGMVVMSIRIILGLERTYMAGRAD